MSQLRVEVQLPAEEAFRRLVAAGNKLGKVEEANELSRFVVIKARYGLNPVRARIAVHTATETSSFLEMQARGQDVWGKASKTVMERIVAAL